MSKDIDREEYLKNRSVYDRELSHQSDILDKYILTISSGSFGLSFLFIEKVVKHIILYPEHLVFSWIMFAFSIISSLLSFICSKYAFSKMIKDYDEMYKDNNKKYERPIADCFTSVFNWYSFFFLLLGFIAFIKFGYINIIKG